MILTNINECWRYAQMHPEFQKLFDFIKKTDFETLPEGRNEIDGDSLFVNHVRMAGKNPEGQPIEIHKDYIDVHFLISGKESIGIKSAGKLSSFSKPYDASCDCALSDDEPDTFVSINPGDMVIVWPEDAHLPAISEGDIHKIIAKVRM
ncbi:MAG: YhcH/YjgK/YiaL family protein [Candidatus Cryptobacteroides sp.]